MVEYSVPIIVVLIGNRSVCITRVDATIWWISIMIVGFDDSMVISF